MIFGGAADGPPARVPAARVSARVPLFSSARSPDVTPSLFPPHPRSRAGPPIPPLPLSCSPRHLWPPPISPRAVIGFGFTPTRFQSAIFIPLPSAIFIPLHPRSPLSSGLVLDRVTSLGASPSPSPFVAVSLASSSPFPSIFSPSSIQVRVASR